MSRLVFCWFVCWLVPFASIAQEAGTQHASSVVKNAVSASQLKFEIGVSKKEVAIDGKLLLDLKLLNVSKSGIYVYSASDVNMEESFSFWLKDAQSTRGINMNAIPEQNMAPASHTIDEFRLLAPGESLTLTYRLAMRNYQVLAGHEYELIADYHSPIYKELGPDIPFLAAENGTLHANHVFFRVN